MPQDVWSLLGMLAAVVLILAMAYGVSKWVAGRGPLYAGGGRGAEALCVLRQISVGRNERLLLVRLQERCLLVGVTAGGMTLLAELTREEAAQWLQKQDGPAAPSFLDALKENLTKKK